MDGHLRLTLLRQLGGVNLIIRSTRRSRPKNTGSTDMQDTIRVEI